MHCSICEREVEAFEQYGVPPRVGRCPHCGAKPRNRAYLAYLIERLKPRLNADSTVVEIGPSRVGLRTHSSKRAIGVARYIAVDLRRLKFHRELERPHYAINASVQQLPLADRCADLILCNNVLPFLPDYQSALQEMRRCLKDDGRLMVETHIDGDKTMSAADRHALEPWRSAEDIAENGDHWWFGTDFTQIVAAADLELYTTELFRDLSLHDKHKAGLKAQVLLMLAKPLARRTSHAC